MKKVLLIIISFLFCIVVNAKTNYSEVSNFANNYIKSFPNNQRYIITKNTNYGFSSSNSIVSNSNYKTGGLLNEQEFLISSGSSNRSYLFNGLTFFTMTESGSQVKVIDPKVGSGITSVNKTNAESGIRVTNYVMSEVKVDGIGTRVNPWRFVDRYNITFVYDDTKIKVSPSTAVVPKNGWVEVNVIETAQYTYVPQTTCGTIDNGKLRISGITSDTTCTINHTIREYTVTLDANNGKLNNTVSSNLNWTLSDENTKATKKILYRHAVGTLPGSSDVERKGYTFKEWLNSNTPIDSTLLITNETTLVANWQANKYKVTYNANGGSISPTYTNQTYDSPYSGLHTPSRDGYTFVGWYLDSTLTKKITEGTTKVETDSNHTIYAKWSANKYKVEYDANGGSGTMADSEATYDQNFVTRKNTFTRNNFTFNGWNEASDGSGIVWALTSRGVYENGNGANPWKWTYTHGITLYAQWLINVTTLQASAYCTTPTYNGNAQAIVSEAPVGFSWSGDVQTNAGTYAVTATLAKGYIWTDGTTAPKSINCSISKRTPIINIDATSGITVVGHNLTFNEQANVAGKFTVTSSSSSVATVAQASSNEINANTNNKVTVTPKSVGSATITVTFTPTDTTNYNSITTSSSGKKTYSVTVSNKVDKPTTSKCKSLTYNGSSQTLVNTADTGYTWTDGTTRKNAGSQDVTATLSTGYRWSDNTVGTFKINCSIARATPTITLDSSSGTTIVGYNLTFNEQANVAGKFTVTSSSSSVATVAQTNSNEITAKTNNPVTVTPKAVGSATITVAFTPTDTTNYNSATSKTYAVTVATKVAKPTASKCKSLTYNGTSQTLVNAADTGYTWSSGTTRTDAGNQDVTATLSSGYRWSDNTTSAVKVNCSIAKATPTITLDSSSGTTIVGYNLTFNEKANVAGKFTVASGSTSIATVAQSSSNAINANTNNPVTVTPASVGSTNITVAFTPTDTTNYNSAASKTYAVTVATKVAKPTTSKCKSLTYNGSSQILVNDADTGYTWSSGTKRTDAGSQDVTATLSTGYRWSDNTTAAVKISCSISPKKLEAPSPSITTAGKVTWGTVSNASSYQVSINGGTWADSKSGSSSIPTTTNGTHTAAVRAVGTGNYATSNSSGNVSATISNKSVVSYEKTKKKCNGTVYWDTTGPNTVTNSNCSEGGTNSCTAGSHVGNTYTTCPFDHWYKTTKTCTYTSNTGGCDKVCASGESSLTNNCNKTCTCAHGTYSNGSCPTYTGTKHTDTEKIECDETCDAGYTAGGTCQWSKTETKYTCKCTKDAGTTGIWTTYTCVWNYSKSSTVSSSSCSESTPSCTTTSHNGNTKVTCSSGFWTGQRTCTKTYYTCDGSTAHQTSSSCSQTPSCSYPSGSYKTCYKGTWSTGGSNDSSCSTDSVPANCTKNGTYVTGCTKYVNKTVKTCKSKNVAFGAASTVTVTTKDETENNFSTCNNAHIGATHISYTGNLGCSSGSVLGDKCIVIN